MQNNIASKQKARNTGQMAEQLALDYLLQHNMLLINKNFHSRFGEIDLIMRDNGTLVFVEVRHRHQSINEALESINYTKQRKLVKAAQYYLTKIGHDVDCRFDAIAIDGKNQIEWVKNIISV